MTETFYTASTGGRIPTGLPGGFLIYEADEDETLLFAETNIIRLFGCTDFEDFVQYTGGSFKGIVHPEDLARIENQIHAQTSFGAMRHDYVRYRIITKAGDIRYVEDFGHLLHWDNGKSFFYVFIVDVDKNEYLNQSVNSIAEGGIMSANNGMDPVTGLLNMAAFYQRCATILTSKESRTEQYSVILFDIPNFKLYNERYGFRQGDELLCEFGMRLRRIFPEDVIARFSDDHFVVCAKGDKEEIMDRTETVCRSMLLASDANRRIRVKAGLYFFDKGGVEIGLACDHARLACKIVKHRHDIYYCVYDERMRDQLRKQQYVVDNVETAIENDYIKIFYQPIIRVSTGEICGYEALARWIDPDVGFLSPADFIETLEQVHMIHMVDQYVVKKVCEDYKELEAAGEALVPISINISRLDFDLCDIFGIVENTRLAYGIPRTMLDIEITESTLNDDPRHVRHECDKMKRMGYHIWLDDFGSGYSSLNSLSDYSFDVLKLDLVFLRNLKKNEKTAALMSYITNGARGLGTEPLCEGVETEEQYEFLKSIGCERAQGYFFGKPMPMRESRLFTVGKGMKWESAK